MKNEPNSGLPRPPKGFFVSFDYSEDAEREVTRFWKEEQRTIILLTVKELLDGNFAHKLV